MKSKWERKTLPKPRRAVRYILEPSLCQRDLQQAVDDAMEAQKAYKDKWRSENMKVNRMIEDMVSK